MTKEEQESFWLSQVKRKNAIWSMSMVGDLTELPEGVPSPVYEGGQQIGVVDIPSELYKLVDISRSVIVFASNITSDGASSAFTINALGAWDVPEVDFNWGLTQGVRDLAFRCKRLYPCNVPKGFNIDSLIELLTNGNVRSFILDYGKLQDNVKEIIRQRGL